MRQMLVSGCLFGWRCRYDGKTAPCTAPLFWKWKAQGRLVPLCPEVWGGLSTPRPPAQRVGQRVRTQAGADVTAAYEAGAHEAVRLAQIHDVAFAILKESSPSCGVRQIYDGTFAGVKIPGQGVAAAALLRAGFQVFSEHELEHAARLLARMETGGA